MQITAWWYGHKSYSGTPSCKLILTWNQWKDHARCMGLNFNNEEGKGGAGAGKRKTPRVCCPFRGNAGLTLMLCRSRRAAHQSRWERWPGKEHRGSALRCALSLSVAGRYPPPPGKRLPWDSRGQQAANLLCRQKGEAGEREKMHLRAWVRERWSAAKSTVFRRKQRNVLWGSLPALKKKPEILKAKENQNFLLCLETSAAYYEGLIQWPQLTSEGFESGAKIT